MSITLAPSDFDFLVSILQRQDVWRSERGRRDFFDQVLIGSPGEEHLNGDFDSGGTPYDTASRAILLLAGYGEDIPGRESLGLLINRLLGKVGYGPDADHLRQILANPAYHFEIKAVVAEPMSTVWRSAESPTLNAERLIGEDTLRHVRILALLTDAARAVVKIVGPKGSGSGFMIAPDLVMTNHHVIGREDELPRCEFVFNYELDPEGHKAQESVSHAKRNGLFCTSLYDEAAVRKEALDYTIVQLADPPKSPDAFAPLPLRSIPPTESSRVTIVQHPDGDFKKVSMQNNFVSYVGELIAQYTTSTRKGSSGSPLFDDDLRVIGLHHGYVDAPSLPKASNDSLKDYQPYRNEGILMGAILEDLRARYPDVLSRLTLC